jgi:hypothetical protein
MNAVQRMDLLLRGRLRTKSLLRGRLLRGRLTRLLRGRLPLSRRLSRLTISRLKMPSWKHLLMSLPWLRFGEALGRENLIPDMLNMELSSSDPTAQPWFPP